MSFPRRDDPPRPFFSRHGDLFEGNDAARGPWDPGACHAGPVTGLLARAVEAAAPGYRLVRLTAELHRPVPMAGFRITATVTRASRSVVTTAATLTDAGGRPCASVHGLHLVEFPLEAPVPTAELDAPAFDDATPGPFPITEGRHDLPAFGTAVEARYPPGQTARPGPTTLWLRTPPLLDGEEPSPFQRVCPLADCGNAISRNSELDRFGFVNADVTIFLVRPPTGEWIGAEAVSHWQPTGIGLADAALFDRDGYIGRAVQSLVVRPVTA
jgi:hypothetical protein